MGIAGLHERDSGFVDARTLVAHAAAVVDDQAHADWQIFAAEDGQLLFDFVFEDAEIFRFQAIGEALAVIENGGVQDDKVDVDLDARALFASVGVLSGRRRSGCGNRNLGERGRREDRDGTQQ